MFGHFDSNLSFLSAADQSILNKIITIRPAEHPWIKCHIKNLIRKRKRIFRKFKRTSNIYSGKDTKYVDNICGQAWTRLNLMRALKFRVSRKSLEKIYISFIRPLLEYCDSVWDNSSTEAKKQLEAIQIEAARTITGATKLCSITRPLDDLGWESLQSRRNKHKLTIFYKIMNGLTPNYLSDLLPPLFHETTSYNLRNSNHIQTVHADTNLFFNSFIPSTIRAWNSLSDDIKSASSVASFKYRLITS